MRVNDANLNSVTTGAQQATRTDTNATNRGSNLRTRDGGQDDRVHLSSLSSALMANSAEDLDRESRIEQLSASYRGGSYKVDAAAVSQRVVDDAISIG